MGQIAKQSFRGTVVTYLGVAIGFVTTFFVITRFLSAEEIGLARVLIDAAVLFVGLAQLGTNASIVRFFPYFCADGTKNNEVSQLNHGFFFWTIVVPVSEYSGNIDDDPFQKYLDTQINRLNIATVANLAIPDGTKTPSGWKLKWSVKNSPEWTSRPVLPIRDFVRRGMTNSKLDIPELIKILDEFRSGKRA